MSLHKSDYRGWYSSHKLPHFDASYAIQFVSFRLADSIPMDVLRAYKREVDALPEEERTSALRMRMESFMDRGYGCCVLAHPGMADVLQQSLQHYDGTRYQLLAWTIMPNHVHVLIEQRYSLPRIVHSWKTWSARWALQNAAKLELTLPTGGFWMRGYWDRYIRNEAHLNAVMHYIRENPVKAGLCQSAQEWPWSGEKR